MSRKVFSAQSRASIRIAIACLVVVVWSTWRLGFVWAVIDQDYESFSDSINGYWWGGDSVIYLDTGGGGWVVDGSSYTGRASAVNYGYVRSRGTETCGITETDTNWDDEEYSTVDTTLWGSGSGFSTAGNCSWYVWQPCKVFATEGSHRVDLYGFGYETRGTEPWVLEVGTC